MHEVHSGQRKRITAIFFGAKKARKHKHPAERNQRRYEVYRQIAE